MLSVSPVPFPSSVNLLNLYHRVAGFCDIYVHSQPKTECSFRRVALLHGMFLH